MLGQGKHASDLFYKNPSYFYIAHIIGGSKLKIYFA